MVSNKYQKGWGVILCPLHTERTASCVLNFNDKTFQCLSCEGKGDFTIEFKPKKSPLKTG